MASRTVEVTRLVWHLELWRSLGGLYKTLGGDSLWRWSCCSISLISAKKKISFVQELRIFDISKTWLRHGSSKEVSKSGVRRRGNELWAFSTNRCPLWCRQSVVLSVRTYLCSCHQLRVKSFRMEALTGRFTVLWCSWAPDYTILCESSISAFRTSQSSLSMTMACPVIN